VKTAARQDQAGKACTSDGGGNAYGAKQPVHFAVDAIGEEERVSGLPFMPPVPKPRDHRPPAVLPMPTLIGIVPRVGGLWSWCIRGLNVPFHVFHRSLSIDENARFEGSSRREETVIDAPRIPIIRPEAQADVDTVVAMEGSRKHNGPLENKWRANE
jgi:hypothetical protein